MAHLYSSTTIVSTHQVSGVIYCSAATPTTSQIKAIIINGETALGAKLSNNEVHCKFLLSKG